MTAGWSYFLDFKDHSFELQEGELTVGRSRACDISVDDPSVSRRHVVIKASGGKILLKDLGSSNGTFVNSTQIQDSAELHQGDTLGLGDADLTVRIVGMSAFETVRMDALPAPSHGDATLFLQEASAKLAQEAMDVGQDPNVGASPNSSHMAPPPPQPAAPSHMAPPPPQPAAPSHMAPPPPQAQPLAPPVSPAPVDLPLATAPVSPAAAAPVSPAAVAPVSPAAAANLAPPPAMPAAAVSPVAPAVPAPPAHEPVMPAGQALPSQDVRLDQTTGELLPSLDGFDNTMGPEMLAALKLEAAEKPVEEELMANNPYSNPYSAPTSQESTAGFGVRLAAALVDGLWMIALNLAAIFTLGQQVGGLTASGFSLSVMLFGWAIWGTTPGKRALKLHISSGNSGQAGIGFPRAIARLVGYLASTILLFGGFLMIAFTQSKRGLHDLIAGTEVKSQS